MLTQHTRHETTPVRATSPDPLHEEKVQLRRRIGQLRGALEAATRDNADLRRRLARAIRENEQLRNQAAPRARHAHERREQWRVALSDPCSRNP
jgi:predicted RNase H-like nuclease (RuvC/YqgF family)